MSTLSEIVSGSIDLLTVNLKSIHNTMFSRSDLLQQKRVN